MYRSWLDAVGSRIAIQQKLVRHTNIRRNGRSVWGKWHV